MTQREALNTMYALLAKHGLYGWTAKINTNKTRLGVCKWTKKRIEISVHHIKQHTDAEVLDTILHEIAHALTPNHMHDAVWRAKALEIGCNGQRCGTGVNLKKRFILKCSHCGRTWFRHRRRTLTRKMYHKKCGPEMPGAVCHYIDTSTLPRDERNVYLQLQQVGMR